MNTNEQTNSMLSAFGWNESLYGAFLPYANQGYIPVRINREGRGLFWGTDGERQLILERSGTFQNMQDLGLQPSPVVGDWCAVQQYASDKGLIEAILSRHSVFHKPVVHESYGIEGKSLEVVANVDLGAIVMDTVHDFNLRRIERFVSLLYADGIQPLLILTKIDLLPDPEDYRQRVLARFNDLPVFLVDSISAHGIETLLNYLQPGITLMLLGLSGAGKSTLVNCLSNAMVAKTGEVRSHDGRGRHTTTSRQLYVLPNGTILIDTPGLRAVGMNSSCGDVSESFSDIHALALQCKFSDCTHTGEPGCAVQQALMDGELEQDRFLNFLELRGEAQSYEQVMAGRKQKDKALGKLLYQYRRGMREYD